MSTAARRAVSVVAIVAAILLAPAVRVWACVPFPILTVEAGSSTAPGAQATVKGTDFGSGAIEVRWNALDGTLLARATGPSFSATVTIPEAPSGTYTIIAMGRSPEGSITAKAPVAFQVGSTAVPPPAAAAEPRTDNGPPAAVLVGGGAALALAGGFVGARLGAPRRREPDGPASVR